MSPPSWGAQRSSQGWVGSWDHESRVHRGLRSPCLPAAPHWDLTGPRARASPGEAALARCASPVPWQRPAPPPGGTVQGTAGPEGQAQGAVGRAWARTPRAPADGAHSAAGPAFPPLSRGARGPWERPRAHPGVRRPPHGPAAASRGRPAPGAPAGHSQAHLGWELPGAWPPESECGGGTSGLRASCSRAHSRDPLWKLPEGSGAAPATGLASTYPPPARRGTRKRQGHVAHPECPTELGQRARGPQGTKAMEATGLRGSGCAQAGPGAALTELPGQEGPDSPGLPTQLPSCGCAGAASQGHLRPTAQPARQNPPGTGICRRQRAGPLHLHGAGSGVRLAQRRHLIPARRAERALGVFHLGSQGPLSGGSLATSPRVASGQPPHDSPTLQTKGPLLPCADRQGGSEPSRHQTAPRAAGSSAPRSLSGRHSCPGTAGVPAGGRLPGRHHQLPQDAAVHS